MWTKYFKLTGIRRGRVITPSHGDIDFSRDDIPVKTCLELYESDFPYLEITEEGKREFYGLIPDKAEAMSIFTPGGEIDDVKLDEVSRLLDDALGESDAEFEPLPNADDNPGELKVSVPIRKNKKYLKTVETEVSLPN